MVSPPSAIGNFNSYQSGEVTIDPSSAIALGVILQAAPNSKIIIAAGVCIGMGTVLHALDGILEIQSGAILGAGVLMVGRGKIGTNACIGSATTIINCSIEPGQVVAPGSLIGDNSRSVDEPPAANHTTVEQVLEPGQVVAPGSLIGDNSRSVDELPAANHTTPEQIPEVVTASTQPQPDQTIQPEPESTSATPVIYGKASLTQLISTLLPYKQSLQQDQNGSSPSSST